MAMSQVYVLHVTFLFSQDVKDKTDEKYWTFCSSEIDCEKCVTNRNEASAQ